MANNNELFNAALAGASGACQERWLQFTNPTAYLAFTNATTAFAAAVDAQIANIPAGASLGQQELLQSICQGVLGNRLLTSTNLADYTAIASAIAALFIESDLNLLPYPFPGGNTAPLTGVAYVDAGSTAVTPNGSIGSAYPTLQAAINAGFRKLIVVPGVYGNIVLPSEASPIVSIGSAVEGASVSLGTITITANINTNAILNLADVIATNVTVNVSGSGTGTVNLTRATIPAGSATNWNIDEQSLIVPTAVTGRVLAPGFNASYLNQTATMAPVIVGPTSLYPGDYIVTQYMYTTIAGSGGIVTPRVDWTDNGAARLSLFGGATLDVSVLDFSKRSEIVRVASTTSILFSFSIAGGSGNPEWNSYCSITKLGGLS